MITATTRSPVWTSAERITVHVVLVLPVCTNVCSNIGTCLSQISLTRPRATRAPGRNPLLYHLTAFTFHRLCAAGPRHILARGGAARTGRPLWLIHITVPEQDDRAGHEHR